MGSSSTSTTSASLPEDVLPNELSHVNQELTNRRNDLWRSNYHEASIYIEEGLNNDKFENHPRKRASKLVPTQNHHQQSPTSAQDLSGRELGQAGDGVSRLNGHLSHHQTSPLLSCLEEKCQLQPATPDKQQRALITADDGTDKAEQRASGNGSGGKSGGAGGGGGGAAFLLGGQYTTIETYILVHNRYFYQLDLAASIVLLLLALVEPPAIDGYELNPTVHAAIEMFALGIIAIELLLKFRWMGPRRFFSHSRTVAKLLVLVSMNCEALVIFFRHSMHARYSRALRPIFLIDNHYCHGLRRAVRQIFQSLPPIIDMFTLALFFMFVFSIFGFYMFAANNHYFSDMPSTVGNLLVLATTANLPDIMMPSYEVSRWSALYFVLFVIIHLFLFTNLTMAAVYEVFTRKEKEKFHKLLLHRRKACQKAFKLLVSRRQPNKIQYRQFMGLMRYLNQKCSMFDAYLIFKALDTDQSGSISLEEFYQIYDFINLEWKLIYPQFKWYDDYKWLPQSCKPLLSVSERVIKHRFFEWTIDLLIAAQAFLQFVEASAFQLPLIQSSSNSLESSQQQPLVLNPMDTIPMAQTNSSANLASPDSFDIKPDKISTYVFISVFCVEMLMRCLTLGWRNYWYSRWNRFDLLVLTISICGLVSGSLGGHPFGWIIVLRILRLMRVFEFKRRYKDMWQTLTYILLKRFVSMTCVVMILYYFFAIIAMELFGDYDLRNCCKNTSVEAQFKYDNSTESMKYYLNDFGDIVASYLTLFSMSSNTYWLTTMSAYAIVSGTNWTRLFFALYYLGSIIVMNIVIAFILESFLFHINYRNRMGDNCDDSNLFTVSVTLSSIEVDFLRENLRSPRDTRHLDAIVDRLARARQTKERKSSKCSSDEMSETASLLGANPKKMTKLSETLSSKRDSSKRSKSRSSVSPQRTGQPSIMVNGKRATNRDDGPAICARAAIANGGQHDCDDPASNCRHRRPEWYLIFQAEQIRNKFSFTMKMYGDEVREWLAQADQEDRDEMVVMIQRNQIRAEHVAMARLARRNLADTAAAMDEGLHPLEFMRPRSWSTSGGTRQPGGGAEHQPETRGAAESKVNK